MGHHAQAAGLRRQEMVVKYTFSFSMNPDSTLCKISI